MKDLLVASGCMYVVDDDANNGRFLTLRCRTDLEADFDEFDEFIRYICLWICLALRNGRYSCIPGLRYAT